MKKHGFTLIELLVVIAIIGLLATIIAASLSTAQAKARDAKRVADIRTLQLALETYYNDNGSYPTIIYSGGALSPYLAALPKDPSTNNAYLYTSYNSNVASGGSSNCISYLPAKYHLGAVLEVPTNTALTQDVDWDGVTGAYTQCNTSGNSPHFDGTSVGCTTTAGTPQPNGTETCYDQTP